MALSGDRVRNETLEAQFPLFQHGEYDFYFPNANYQIGLKTTYPESLKKKIAAALICEFLGKKSVDSVLRTYLRDVTYPVDDGARLDLRVREVVRALMAKFDGQLFAINVSFDGVLPGNAVIGLLTLQRASFSMDFLAFCGQRGALFEGLAVARMMLEQIAWSLVVAKSLDDDAVHKVSATRAITFVKSEIAAAGVLYGWLSAHAHWQFDAHKKVVTSREEKLVHLFGSSYFKACVFCVMLIVTNICFQALWAICPDELQKLQSEPGAQNTTMTEVKFEVEALLDEIAACAPEDDELQKLATMLNGNKV